MQRSPIGATGYCCTRGSAQSSAYDAICLPTCSDFPWLFIAGKKQGISWLGRVVTFQTWRDFVVSAGTGLFVHLLTIVGMATIMLIVDWRFALVVMSMLPLMLLMMQHYRKLIKRSFRTVRQKEGELWGKVQEIIVNV